MTDNTNQSTSTDNNLIFEQFDPFIDCSNFFDPQEDFFQDNNMLRSTNSAFMPYSQYQQRLQPTYYMLPAQPALISMPSENFSGPTAERFSLHQARGIFEEECNQAPTQFLQIQLLKMTTTTPSQLQAQIEMPSHAIQADSTLVEPAFGHQKSSCSSEMEYSNSKCDNQNDYSDDSNHCQSTIISGLPSPVLSDKSLVEKSTTSQQKSSQSIDDCLDIANYKLEFSDLNECVTALLKKAKDDNSLGRDIKRRQRKNKDQLKVLENEFLKNPDWTRNFIRSISQKLALRECQVYKWHWDQRKKEGMTVGTYPMDCQL